jgi:hypothetical protein
LGILNYFVLNENNPPENVFLHVMPVKFCHLSRQKKREGFHYFLINSVLEIVKIEL